MPSPFKEPRLGVLVPQQPTGFPLFFDRRKPRVITADVWSYLKLLSRKFLNVAEEKRAVAYIDQAYEFYEAASNPRTGSKPLLYYYSFLNLAKAYLVMKKIDFPAAIKHGIQDPKVNNKSKIRFEGQVVTIDGRAHDKSNLYPEFMHAIRGPVKPKSYSIIDIFEQIACVHRVFISVTERKSRLLPIKKLELLQGKSSTTMKNEIWCRIIFDAKDYDVKNILPSFRKKNSISKILHQVKWADKSEHCFESRCYEGEKRAIDSAIKKLSNDFRQIGVAPILTKGGYKFYFSVDQKVDLFPPLGSMLATIYYLGSITRYKPYAFDTLLASKYSWLISEVLAIVPNQFLYLLASEASGVDVVYPYASQR